jgi:hypothetical protein
MFSRNTIDEINQTAARLGIEAAALLAVAEVESGGRAFAVIDGRNEPVIRFEGHYFDRRLSGSKRDRARRAGLADPGAGKISNPSDQAARWKLLGRAAGIDSNAAYESTSWGIGQVMGAHWAWLGYASVDDLVAEARRSVGGQVDLMARYIEKAGLTAALSRCDWATFARGYNGPDYKRHRYDRKIAKAYARYSGPIPDQPATPRPARVLARGATGPLVVDLQTLLVAAGHAVARDGIFGLQTEQAVRRFQSTEGLSVDGIAGPQTMAALGAALSTRRWWSGITRWFWNLVD